MSIDLAKKYKNLFVHRKGRSPTAFMDTKSILMEIQPTQRYLLQKEGLQPTTAPSTPHSKKIAVPPYATLKGKWITNPESNSESSNILGGITPFWAENKTLSLPIAPTDSEHIAYYGGRLLSWDEVFTFDSPIPLPLFKLSVGQNYMEDYILQKRYANGFFIEYHNLPHFHMPMNAEAKGFLVLGKKVAQEQYHLSAFRIPFGQAIYLPPYVIHDDAMLIGDYYVAYGQADTFSTVRLLRSPTTVLPIQVDKA